MGKLLRFAEALKGKQTPEQKEDADRAEILANSRAMLKLIEGLAPPDLSHLAEKVDVSQLHKDLEVISGTKIDFSPVINALPKTDLKPVLRAVENINVNPVVSTDLAPVNDVLNTWLDKIMTQVSKDRPKRKFTFNVEREDFSDLIKTVEVTEQ